MLLLRAQGFKIVYDSDDNLWSLPAYNPAKKAFEAMQEGFDLCIKEAHVVTVSTQGLATALKNRVPHLKADILVTPNALNFDMYHPTELNRNDGRILVGWAGSNTHSGDLDEAAGALISTLNKYPTVNLQFVGMIPDRMHGLERVSFRPWIPVGEWANRFASFAWDISLAPLQDNRFNRSKSNLKMLESAAMRIPCLASDVQPYHEFCSLGGKDLEWLLCRFNQDWEKKLDRLIQDPLYRCYLGDLMANLGISCMLDSQNAEYAQAHFDILKRAWRYFSVADPYSEDSEDVNGWALGFTTRPLPVNAKHF